MSRLQDVRVSTGISQAQLAKLSSIDVRVIQAYECHARNIDGAKLNTLIDLANALGCKLSDILESDELKSKLKEVLV